jgi:hypothetical protein
MPLIVEDGTGVEDANSYVSVAEADAYYSDRNIINWAGLGATNATKEGLLIQAADHLNQFFTWKGEPYDVNQRLGLPTLTYDYIPWPVKHAQILLAREALAGPLSTTFGNRLITSERKKLDGVGETEIQYERTRVDGTGRVGSSIASMLRPYTLDRVSIQSARVEYS